MTGSNVRGLYTVVEAGLLLGVGRSTMYELVNRGEVSSLRLGRKVLITRTTLEAILGYSPPSPAEMAALGPTPALRLVDSCTAASPATEGPVVQNVHGSTRRR